MDRFLKILSEMLEKEHWGDIEPEWFSPEFLIVEDGEEQTEDQQWAEDLQKTVKMALKKAGLVRPEPK
jgi:hypothetical protein